MLDLVRASREERAAREREVDPVENLGVVRAPIAPPGVHAEVLSDDRLFVAAPLRHPLITKRKLDLAALAREPLVSYGESSQTRGRIAGLIDLGASVRIEVEGKSAALAYVRRGLGIAFVSALPSAKLRAPGVAFRDVTELFARARFFVVRAVAAPSTLVAAAATDLIRAARERVRSAKGSP